MTTPPTDDLRARHVGVLREWRDHAQGRLDYFAGHSLHGDNPRTVAERDALDAAIAALSALPAGGGDEVPEDWTRFTFHDQRIACHPSIADRVQRALLREATTPQPSAAEGVIAAAEAYASNYNDDDRQDIKADVMNAFFAGSQYKDTDVGAQGEGLRDEPAFHGRVGRLAVEFPSSDGEQRIEYLLLDGKMHKLDDIRRYIDIALGRAAPAAGKGVDDVATAVERLKDRTFPQHECPAESAAVWNVALYELQAALTRQPVAGGGMVLVPREPTCDMHEAGVRARNRGGTILDIYRAMIAAAPAATPTDGGEGSNG